MIYDDQRAMERAAATYTHEERWGRETLVVAFNAIDREALIEKGYRALKERGSPSPNALVRGDAEAVLIAAGIIPERS